MKTKAADAERQAATIAEAVEKAKAEMNVSSEVETAEALVKRHGEELKALEEKLKAEHEAALKVAVEEALKSRPEGSSDVDTQAAINGAVSEAEKKAQTQLQEEISAALERGRMEQAAKNKLKDSQLVKAQKRVKELEQQIHEWQASGIPPSVSGTTPTTPVATLNIIPAQPVTKLAATGQPSAATESTGQPPSKPLGAVPSSQPKPPITSAAATTSQPPLPRKPPLGPSGGRGTAIRGRGGLLTRGGAPLRQPPVKPSAPTAPASGGVSIIGAASKRPREELSSSSEDSLAKRLKPADAST